MESSGQVTKTEEMMINDESNDASRTCSRWDKRAGERRHGSQYCGELLWERSSERSMPSGRHLVQKYDPSGQIRHSGKIEKFKRRCDCSQNQSWRVADHVTRTKKLRRFLSWLQWIKYWSRCWIWTPDSITSDRIWCWYRNAWLLNQRNSPPGNYDPRNHLQRTLADIMIRRPG